MIYNYLVVIKLSQLPFMCDMGQWQCPACQFGLVHSADELNGRKSRSTVFVRSCRPFMTSLYVYLTNFMNSCRQQNKRIAHFSVRSHWLSLQKCLNINCCLQYMYCTRLMAFCRSSTQRLYLCDDLVKCVNVYLVKYMYTLLLFVTSRRH